MDCQNICRNRMNSQNVLRSCTFVEKLIFRSVLGLATFIEHDEFSTIILKHAERDPSVGDVLNRLLRKARFCPGEIRFLKGKINESNKFILYHPHFSLAWFGADRCLDSTFRGSVTPCWLQRCWTVRSMSGGRRRLLFRYRDISDK